MTELSTHAVQTRAMPQRFGYGRTLTGFEVIDNATGRPVGFERDTAQEANGVAQSLNRAALSGPRTLAAALGATPATPAFQAR
jgi:hypothetical protein